MGEVDRCRKLYAKYLEKMPFNCQVRPWRLLALVDAALVSPS